METIPQLAVAEDEVQKAARTRCCRRRGGGEWGLGASLAPAGSGAAEGWISCIFTARQHSLLC